MKLDMISLQVDRYVSKPAYLALKMVGFSHNFYPVYHLLECLVFSKVFSKVARWSFV